MTTTDFAKYWELTYPKCPPVGYLLRKKFPERWFRIHTLPNSKRYPDTTAEKGMVLSRHNAILSDLLDRERACLLVAGRPSSKKNAAENQLKISEDVLEHFLRTKVGDEDDSIFWDFFIKEIRWSFGTTDKLLDLIADDYVQNILLVEVEKHSIYHPYDGGADIFIENASQKLFLQTKYSNWESNRPDKL